MRRWLLLPVLLAASLPIAQAEPPAAAPQVPAGLEGGTPIPAGAGKVTFGWIGKQSIIATGDAFERMVAQVDFSDDKRGPLGSVTLDGKGGGTGEFAVRVTDLKTGSTSRDEHLRGDQWLDVAKFPDIKLTISKLEQVKPTVFRMEGTWSMHGQTQAISAWANVRYLPEMMYLGKDVVRVKTTFTISLKAFGLTNPAIGSPACSDLWQIEVVALGLLTK